MTRAKDISKILTDADISGNIDVDGVTNLDVVDIDGALTQDGGAVFNEASADVDFRVESNGNANMLFVDGSNDKIGVNTNSPDAIFTVDSNVGGSSTGTIARFHSSKGESDSTYLQIAATRHGTASVQRVQLQAFDDDGSTGRTLALNPSGGLVGIGTNSPNTIFTTSSASEAVGVSAQTATTGSFIGFKDATSTNWYYNHIGAVGDNLKFTTGGSEKMRIDQNGAVTMPLQPAFLVQGTAVSNVGLNADHTIAFGTEIFDQNADFASNVFTAPVTGKYQFNLSVRIDNLDDATQYYMIQIRTSNRDIQSIHGMSGYDADVSYMSFNLSVLTDMDAGDTSRAILGVPSLGSAQADLTDVTRFSGYLVA